MGPRPGYALRSGVGRCGRRRYHSGCTSYGPEPIGLSDGGVDELITTYRNGSAGTSASAIPCWRFCSARRAPVRSPHVKQPLDPTLIHGTQPAGRYGNVERRSSAASRDRRRQLQTAPHRNDHTGAHLISIRMPLT